MQEMVYLNKKLVDRFLSENKIKNDVPSAAALAHFFLTLDSNPDSNAKIQNVLNDAVLENHPEREVEALDERNEIQAVDSYDKIIQFMRRNTDPINQHILIDKALEFELQIVPDIVKKLRTSLNDGFVETSIRILMRSTCDFVDEVFGYYDDIRSPYTQSMVLILLGFKLDDTHIPWFIEKFNVLRKNYPQEHYYEGAYYAILEINKRFYE